MSFNVQFSHSAAIWRDFPELVPGVLRAEGLTPEACVHAHVDAHVARYTDVARGRLAGGSEADLPEVQAWRRAFSRMGLKPTQYRCAAEALLRRFRKESALPRLGPVVDLCNAASLAYGIPVAALDLSRITGPLEVRYATGHETYLTFAGDEEHPESGEVVFADVAGRAHARRWTNRQSGHSAVRDDTSAVLVVAEAMHAAAPKDVPSLLASLAGAVRDCWAVTAETSVLSQESPSFG